MSVERLAERLLFVGIAVLACSMPAQNDTWWHLRAGYDMLDSGRVLLVETFSHTVQGQPWPNYEWLTQVTFALLHRAGGMPLLSAACALAAVGGLWLVYDSMRGDRMVRILLLAGVVAGVTITWSLRPQAFTLFMLGLTTWLVRRQYWAPLPPLFLLWANLHGAVALGGIVLGGAVLAVAARRERPPAAFVAVVLLCAAATFLTPLGTSYWHEIAASIGRSRVNDIAEWRPPEPPPAHLVFWLAAVALPFSTWRWRSRLVAPGEWSLACAALLMLPLALRSMRNISPFLMVAAPALSALWDSPAAPARDPAISPWRQRAHAAVLAVAVLTAGVTVAHAWRTPWQRLGWHPIQPGAARAVEGCPGRLYNRYIDGGPLVFFAPRQLVLLDSRQDPYPTWLVRAQHEVEVTGSYHAFFERHGIQCAAVPPSSPLAAVLLTDGWHDRYRDRDWVVLERPPVQR